MGSYKTAAPCEVCGLRVSHGGSNVGFIVGYTTKGIPRLVHERCRREWERRGTDIMHSWAELREHVFATLNPGLRHRIQRCLGAYRGATMPKVLNRERFVFPPQVTEEIRRVIKRGDVRKGVIKKLYEVLQREHADWMPPSLSTTGYSDFYQLWTTTKNQLNWEQERTPAGPTPPEVPAASDVPHPKTGGTPSVETDELHVMGRAAHALVDLAVARSDRDGVQLVLEALSHLLMPTKP